jgi:hypothetical protein
MLLMMVGDGWFSLRQTNLRTIHENQTNGLIILTLFSIS